MSAASWTIRQLRELAAKRLGAQAARLKTKGELYDALARHAPDALGLPAFGAEPLPAEPPVALAPAPQHTAPPEPAFAALSAPLPGVAPSSSAGNLPQEPKASAAPRPETDLDRVVVRDFFQRPGERRLPATYGDDRVLVFPRDPGGAWVSWDFRPETWGHGAHRLLLRTPDGRVLWSLDPDAPAGGAVVEGALDGEVVRALVLDAQGRELSGSAAVALPGVGPGEGDGAGDGAGDGPRAWVRVDPARPLSGAPELLRELPPGSGAGEGSRSWTGGAGVTSRAVAAGAPRGGLEGSAHSRAGPHSRAR